jgi:transposase
MGRLQRHLPSSDGHLIRRFRAAQPRRSGGSGLKIGDIDRFASPKKLAGYTGLCPLVRQSGGKDRRGPLAKNGPTYLRWALIEAATRAARDPRYRERYERTKQRLGRQRGAKVARVDLARQLAEAIWHVLTKNEPFHPAGPAMGLVA